MGPLQVQEKGVDKLLGSLQGVLMLIRILAWNVRGINDEDKRKVVKPCLRLQKGRPNLFLGDKNPVHVRSGSE